MLVFMYLLLLVAALQAQWQLRPVLEQQLQSQQPYPFLRLSPRHQQ